MSIDGFVININTTTILLNLFYALKQGVYEKNIFFSNFNLFNNHFDFFWLYLKLIIIIFFEPPSDWTIKIYAFDLNTIK